MSDEIEESIVERCLNTLKNAKSDTEIFSALLIVTKIVKADDADRSTCKRIYEAVGFDFIERMLSTTEMASSCPSYMYQSVAFTIISSFCTEEEFAVDPRMFKFMDNFKSVLLSSPSDPDEQFMVSDVMQCITSIANFEVGKKKLLDNGIVPCFGQMIEEELYNHEEALSTLVVLVKYNGNQVWNSHYETLSNVVQKIALEFRDDNNERKFELCAILFELLLNFPSSAVNDTNVMLKKDWINWIHKGLNDILKSRITKEQRDPALLLLSVMLENFGTEWLIQGDDESDKKFVLVVVHLMCIEIRLSVEMHSLQKIMKESYLITSCYTVLEKLIMAVTSEDYILGLDQKQFLQFGSALTGAFKAIIQFLNQVDKAWELNQVPELHEAVFRNFVMASFRVLCCWLAEETSAARDEVNEILPFLFKLAKDNLNNTNSVDDKENVDIMRFFLAPLCHLSAEDSSRIIMIDRRFHHVIATYLDIIWKKFKVALFHCDELEAALSAICGIFMNIVVLQSELIVTEDVFHEILVFTITALPQLNNKRDLLIVRANFAVLGLLLMKHYVSKVNSNEMIMYKYLSATLKFLWDAHNVDDSSDSKSLVVNLDYRRAWEDINELWFLGMQALSSILNAIPWICDFILESGWTQELLDNLSRVKAGSIELNIKCTYENFLCSLVKSDSHREIFSKSMTDKGALKICQTHELVDLQFLLKAYVSLSST